MSYGIFIDKKHRPSNAEINATLGKTKGLWESLIQSIRDKINVQEDFSFLYGKNYGWGLRFRYKGKLLICFYPNTNYFVTQLILNTQYLSDPIIDTLHSIVPVKQLNQRRHIKKENGFLSQPKQIKKLKT